MGLFKINKEKLQIEELSLYRYKNEGYSKTSPQVLMAKFPSLTLSIPELDVIETEKLLVARECNTTRGPIDLLIITENADIVLVETKLIRNPESHRTVVAQAIDYAKALTQENVNQFKRWFNKSEFTNSEIVNDLFNDSNFESTLDKNIRTGNFKVLIAGDKIHPNVLNMVESIQSAPHLSFTMFLAEIQPFSLDEDNIIIQPTIVAKTNEVERSVIRLEIDYKEQKHLIESAAPEEEGKGNKPIQSAEEYLNTLSVEEFKEHFRKFWKRWRNIGGDVRFGTTGFSIGISINGSRYPLQFFYDDNFYLIMSSTMDRYGISDKIYENYKQNIRATYPKAHDLLVANKVKILYSDISIEELTHIFDAVVQMVEELKKTEE